MFIYLKLSVMLYFSLPNPPSPLYTVMSYTVEREGACHIVMWYQPAMLLGLYSPQDGILLFVCLMAWNDPPHIQFLSCCLCVWWLGMIPHTFSSGAEFLFWLIPAFSQLFWALAGVPWFLLGSIRLCDWCTCGWRALWIPAARAVPDYLFFIFVEEQTCFGLL